MEMVISEKDATICLNMIVKDESHIVRSTLEKLCNKIKFDYWVICDTGSTDNTPEIIQNFFQEKEIKGEIYFDEWINFAHNRTIALQRAYKKTDLLFIFDADDEICGTINIPKQVLFDQYHLKFGSKQGTSYTRVLLINNHRQFEYLSVIHEFISCKEENASNCIIDGDYYVVSGRSGSRNKDPDKYLKDAIVLEKAYDEALQKNDHLFHRYAFYCANSYKDCGRYEDAIKWYKTTLSHQNQWAQEKYVSCLSIYDCYERMNQREAGFYYLVKAFSYDSQRVECIYNLLVHYCCENMHSIAYNYYLTIKNYFENNYLNFEKHISNKLFVVMDKYNFFVPYYMILIADKVQDFNCVVKMYEIIFTKKQPIFSEWYIGNLFYNLKYFLKYVSQDNNNFSTLANEYIKYLYDNGVNLNNIRSFNDDYELYIKHNINVDFFILKEITNKPMHYFSLEECKNSKNILIYTGFSNIDWNYTYTLDNALGGSEKAVAYLSKCFPKNYKIFVSGHVKNEIIENIHYVHLNDLSSLIQSTPFHTVIVSRYISFYEMFKECSFYQSFIWAHDVILLAYGSNLNANQILKKWSNYINGCICLTEWHKNLFIEKYAEVKDKIHIINNGIDIDNIKFNEKKIKIQNKFIYSSRPDRGLDVLLDLWPKILQEIPDATLSICCYGTFPSKPEEQKLQDIIDKYDNITHLGKLSADKLYEEMRSSEFWLYPTHWPETSCITALEMLMSEVICLYYPVAGLVNTMDKCGIQIRNGNEIENIINLSYSSKRKLRDEGRKYAESCSWINRSVEWLKILNLSLSNESTNNTNMLYNYETNFVKIVNLERRSDRLEDMKVKLHNIDIHNYEVIKAVDGSTLEPSMYLKKLFENNDFNYRKGVIGCALSHLNLWKQLVIDEKNDFYVVFEDDITFVDDFKNKLNNILNKVCNTDDNIEFCLLGGGSISKSNENIENLHVLKRDDKTVDGLYGYIVTKSGAKKMIDYISYNNIKRAIDTIYTYAFDYIHVVNEHLVFTPSFQLHRNTDTDIQQDYNCLIFDDNNSTFFQNVENNVLISNSEKHTNSIMNHIPDKETWIFFPDKTYKKVVIEDYLDSYNDHANFYFINDINNIPSNPNKIFIVNHLFQDSESVFDKFPNSEISMIITEQLSNNFHLERAMNAFNKRSNIKFYSYSKSNIKILNDNNIINTEFLPYMYNELEINSLKNLNSTTKKEYDFGIICYTPNVYEATRKERIVSFLRSNNFKVNVICGWKLIRDTELSKCNVILNIHSNITRDSEDTYNIFEHIRCDRLLYVGFKVLSEESYCLDEDFINQFSNLKIFSYEQLLDINTYNDNLFMA